MVSQVTDSATYRVAVPSSSASAPHAHDWVFRNPAIAGDTFQLSALLKSEPTLTSRTAYKEGIRAEVWPPLAAEVITAAPSRI